MVSFSRYLFSLVISLSLFITINGSFEEEYLMHGYIPAFSISGRNSIKSEENFASYWIDSAKEKLKEHLLNVPNLNKAKNVIFFLGDGMSIPTITAARILKGQLENRFGEEGELHMETFPYTGLSKTFCANGQVADSACSATAYLGGVKANLLTIGLTANATMFDCEAEKDQINHVVSLAEKAQKVGKATGIVTTTTVTHASPAGNYAHTAFRLYENDHDIARYRGDTENCRDIAQQLIFDNPGRGLNVILGGGRSKFLPNSTVNYYECGNDGHCGDRLDNQNLIQEWLKQKSNHNPIYVKTREELLNNIKEENDYLLGLFNDENLDFVLDADKEKQPSLAEMTKAALKVLQKNENGYYLFVEGGRIDHGHHETKAVKALHEALDFDKAIEIATEMTSSEDTLIVVTADHAHTMTISGYSTRGANILGLSSFGRGSDRLPYTTLSYANGLGYRKEMNGQRFDISKSTFGDKDFHYPSTVPLSYETHGGDDVAVFAKGPWAHLFTGSYQQHVIPHIISFAACFDDENDLTACNI